MGEAQMGERESGGFQGPHERLLMDEALGLGEEWRAVKSE